MKLKLGPETVRFIFSYGLRLMLLETRAKMYTAAPKFTKEPKSSGAQAHDAFVVLSL